MGFFGKLFGRTEDSAQDSGMPMSEANKTCESGCCESHDHTSEAPGAKTCGMCGAVLSVDMTCPVCALAAKDSNGAM